MPATGPSPDTRHPIPGATRTGFLRPCITRPTIVVGEYTYYDDPRGPERFEENVLYHFDFIGDFTRHFGLFAGCGDTMPFDPVAAGTTTASTMERSGCC